jgi:peptidyl-prolyl cis-trans isomerase B (cyclophilin B)
MTQIQMNIKDYGVLKIELNEAAAPKTVANFLKLVNEKFYDGLSFHRIIPGFMIQGGCPLGSGTGGPGYHIEGEFSSNGFENPLKHTKGVISMARSGHPNSAGSQFFIMHEASPHLDGQYAAFGQVIEGLEIIDTIAHVKTGFQDKPIEKVVIEQVIQL